MRTAPDTCTTPTHPAAAGAASFRRLTLATAAALALAACATPQTSPVLPTDDTSAVSVPERAPRTISEATDRAIDRVKPEPRPAVR